MPCPDFVNARPEKSVPPKKSHSWRSHNITLSEHPTHNSVLNFKDSTPGSGENRPMNMGLNSVRPDLQNNGHGFETLSPPKNLHDDMPLDFSLKPETKNCHLEDRATSTEGGQSNKQNGFEYSFKIPKEERNGNPVALVPNGINSHFSSNPHKNVQKPVKTAVSPRNANYFEAINIDLSETNGKFPDAQSTKSPSPNLQSPSSSSKSPILAGMLAGPTEMMSAVEALNSRRLMPYGLTNGYANGFGPVCVPGVIQNPNSVMANPSIFPSNIIAPSGLAFMQSQMNMLPPVTPVPLQSKIECKATRKGKQERPFKNYDVSLQDDLQCNTLPWAAIPSINSRAINESNQSDAHHPGSVTASSPTRANPVNGISENSLHSDPLSVVSGEMDNSPHSSMPNNVLEEQLEADKNNRSRKRKPVAESEKDASYWERRKKNNQAAKRSRENRRIKEDTVAQQAIFFRAEVTRLSQIVIHLNARIHESEMKCVSLEQDKLALTAENAMFKQALSQKRCGECGNPLANKLL